MKRQMRRSKWIVMGSLLVLLATALSAFGAPASQPAVKPPPTAKMPVAKPSAPAVSQTQVSQAAYRYNPQGKPDPFKPFVSVQMTAAKKEKAATKVESIFPLQKAGVDNFNLVGIMGDETRRVAVVEDAAKKFYPLVVGTRMGLHNGKVTNILADRIIVDELDGKKTKRIILKLRNN
jgi:type IV pilus assembly protein PilP